MALAGLKEGVITPQTSITDLVGFITIPNIYNPDIVYTYRDWRIQGTVDLKKALAWSSDIYLDETRYKRMLERIRDFDPQNLKVECADFQQVIKNHTNDFLYCDPPYYIGDDSKMFKGIYPMRNIPVHHNGFPHELLRDLLKSHKGGFILSYNNCPTIRKYYKEFQQLFPSWQYTMGQGEKRIGKNRIENGDNHIKQSHEIIIFCPPKN